MLKTNVVFCSFPDFSSHSKALFLYMQKQNFNDINIIWVVNSKEMQKRLKEKGIKTILFGSNGFEKIIEKADIIFSTHGNLIDYKKEKTIYVDLWHGIGVKPAGYLINKISDFDLNWLEKFRKNVDYMIVPSQFWQMIFSSIFHIRVDRILPLGYPKFDLQKTKKSKSNLKKILNQDINKYKKIVYYMPTIKQKNNFKEEKNIDLNKIFNLKDENNDKLNKFLKDNNILLCIKRHPSEENKYNNYESENIRFITNSMLEKHELDVDEILNAADIMISDYSSLAIEFKFLDKKTIFINNNLKEFEKNRGIFFNNFSYWTEKIEVQNFEELKKEILRIDNYDNSEKKELWFGKLKNGGCKNIYNYFFENQKIKKNINNTWCKEKILENKLEEERINSTNTLKEKKKQNDELLNTIKQKNIEYDLLLEQFDNKKQELEKLKNSKFYLLYSKLQKIYLLLIGGKHK